MSVQTVEPFVLKERIRVAPEPEPSGEEVYDHDRQLWIDRSSGEAIVLRLSSGIAGSKFGETTVTETREGIDQSEVASIQASQFGETTMTKTFEGTDQLESIQASPFGETTITATVEGADASEAALAHENAAHTHF